MPPGEIQNKEILNKKTGSFSVGYPRPDYGFLLLKAYLLITLLARDLYSLQLR